MQHRAGRERVEAGERVHERRLAGARRAHDRGEATGLEVDGHVVERTDLGLALAVDLRRVDGPGGDGAEAGRRGLGAEGDGDWGRREQRCHAASRCADRAGAIVGRTDVARPAPRDGPFVSERRRRRTSRDVRGHGSEVDAGRRPPSYGEAVENAPLSVRLTRLVGRIRNLNPWIIDALIATPLAVIAITVLVGLGRHRQRLPRTDRVGVRPDASSRRFPYFFRRRAPLAGVPDRDVRR